MMTMKQIINYRVLLFSLTILLSSCTDYKKGIKNYNEKKYDTALIYLKKVDSTDNKYNMAQNKIAEIDSILLHIETERVRQYRQDSMEFIIRINGHPETGAFTDTRDAKVYKTIKIGDQVWMAENLAYQPRQGKYWAYNHKLSNLTKYGYLYDAHTALNVCPPNWRLPSKSDFETLVNNVGGIDGNGSNGLKDGGYSGFNGLFGGFCLDGSDFFGIDSEGVWWGTESQVRVYGRQRSHHYSWHLKISSNGVYINESPYFYEYSVRCIQD